jgi:hypothetical protein
LKADILDDYLVKEFDCEKTNYARVRMWLLYFNKKQSRVKMRKSNNKIGLSFIMYIK